VFFPIGGLGRGRALAAVNQTKRFVRESAHDSGWGRRRFLRALPHITLFVLFAMLVVSCLDLKEPTATGIFTRAASRCRMIIGDARASTTEQNLDVKRDALTVCVLEDYRGHAKGPPR
jgi:hypothetical protein